MKQFKLTFLLALLMSMIGINAFAEIFWEDGICYNRLNNHWALVEVVSTSYSQYQEYLGTWDVPDTWIDSPLSSTYTGKIVIPSEVHYGSYKVIRIAENAFYNSEITSITIPNSVKFIGYNAFYGCSKLQTVNVSNDFEYEEVDIGNLRGVDLVGIGLENTPWYKSQPNGMIYLGKVAYHFKDNYYNPTITDVTIKTGTTRIGSKCFYKNSITSVTIPSSIVSIGRSAFQGCSGLQSIILSENVKKIGNYAFCGCSGLTSLNLPSNLYLLGCGAFFGCTGLKDLDITISDNIRVFYKSTFSGCTLSSLTIGKGIKVVRTQGDSWTDETLLYYKHVYDCDYPYIISPDYYESVPSYSGYYDYNSNYYSYNGIDSYDNYRTDINAIQQYNNLPISMWQGDYSYYYDGIYMWNSDGDEWESWSKVLVHGLDVQNIRVAEENTVIDSRNNSNAIIHTSTNTLIIGSSNTVIPNTITKISKKAFQDCSVTSINIPSSVIEIGDEAFRGSKLTSITIPATVQSMGVTAFANCDNLTSVVLEDGATTVSKCQFAYCTNLSSVSLPSSVTSVGQNAFTGTSLYDSQPDGVMYAGTIAIGYGGTMPENTYISLNYGTTAIADYAFSNCKNMTGVSIPSTVKSIGAEAYYYCTGLTSLTIPASVEKVGASAFGGCSGLKTIYFYCKNVGNWFNGNKSITKVYLYDGVTSISASAFANCSNLETLSVANSVYSIGSDAFKGTAWQEAQPEGLAYAGKVAYKYIGDMPDNTEIVLKSGTKGIAGSAFDGCAGLKQITIPTSVQEIGNYAFKGCCGLKSITLPEKIEAINSYTFSGCSNLKSVVLPPKVKSIHEYAFVNCTALNNILIHNNINTIERHAFSGCSSLESVTIPSSVTSIGYSIFSGCSGLARAEIHCEKFDDIFNYLKSLKEVFIGNEVTELYSYAFSHCDSLISVTIDKQEPLPISSSTFSNRRNATLYVPYGCKAAYVAADYWKEFKEIKELPDRVNNTIEPKASTGCKGSQTMLAISMKNVEEIVGFQFDLQLPVGFELATNAGGNYLANLTDRKDDHTLSVNKIGDNKYRFVSVSMNNKLFAGANGVVVNLKLKIDESIAVGNYDIKVKDTELTTANKEIIHSVEGTAVLTVIEAEPGDVNGDMAVSVTDVSCIIGRIMNETPAIFIESAADLNGDHNVSVTDAVLVIDKILNAGKPSNARKKAMTEQAQAGDVLTVEDITVHYGGETTFEVGCEFETEFKAFQFDIELPEGLSLVVDESGKPVCELGFAGTNHTVSTSTIANGKYRFVCTSISNSLLPLSGILLKVKVTATSSATVGENCVGKVTATEFTDVDYERNDFDDVTFMVRVGEDPIGINNVRESIISFGKTFDLQGRKLAKPQKGINIIRHSDGSIRKVLVK